MARGIRQAKDVHSNVQDKQSEISKKSKVYSTAKINQMIEELAKGGEPDMDPFWHGQQQYRDAGIIYEYTDEELEEIEKCTNDPIYFVEKYCTFKNDSGRSTVRLREYQKRTLHLYGDEEYDEVSDTIIPKHRRIVIMQSRQTGKCLSPTAHVELLDYDEKAMQALLDQKYSIKALASLCWQKLKDRWRKG